VDNLQFGFGLEHRNNNFAQVLALVHILNTTSNLLQSTQTSIIYLNDKFSFSQSFNHLLHVLREEVCVRWHEETRYCTRARKELQCIELVALDALLRGIARDGTNDQQTTLGSQAKNEI
jgi:hypothetical protein